MIKEWGILCLPETSERKKTYIFLGYILTDEKVNTRDKKLIQVFGYLLFRHHNASKHDRHPFYPLNIYLFVLIRSRLAGLFIDFYSPIYSNSMLKMTGINNT